MGMGSCKEQTGELAPMSEFKNQTLRVLQKGCGALGNTLASFTYKTNGRLQINTWLGLRSLDHLINRHITPLISFSSDVVQPIDNINLPIAIGTSSICLSPSLTVLSLTM
ncbi:unnamed protein product [Prunus brigantina]